MHRNVLDKDKAILLVIDIQERFGTIVQDVEELLNKSSQLVKAFNIMELPVVYTEQYPKGLGSTMEPLKSELKNAKYFDKFAFSCCKDPAFMDYIKSLNRPQVVVCGLEGHVCVNQTVHDLLEAGLQPHIVVDAITCRNELNFEVAVEKMTNSGAVISTVEMVLFELMVTAKFEKFREIQALIM